MSSELRTETRHPVNIEAQMSLGDQTVLVRLPNISPNGALISCEAVLPSRGNVIVHLPGVDVRAAIRWARGRDAGVMFHTPLSDEVVSGLVSLQK